MTRIRLVATFVAIAIYASVWADSDPVLERLIDLVGPEAGPVISSTPIDGLVQVMLGSEVFFMTSDGQYLIKGQVVDLDTRNDLGELAMRDYRQRLIQAVDMDTMISFGPSDADHDLIVFTDTDCGYCRRLHALLDDYNALSIRVHYAAFPRAGVGSSTHADLVSVWCSDHPHQAMDLAQAGRPNPPRQCDTPIQSHMELGRQLKITGTPTMVLSSGELIAGIPKAEDLLKQLDQKVALAD